MPFAVAASATRQAANAHQQNSTSRYFSVWAKTRQLASKVTGLICSTNWGGIPKALDTSMPAPSVASERTVQSIADVLALKTIRPALSTRRRAERAGSGFLQAMHRFRPRDLASY